MLSGARGSARKAFALLIVLSLVFSLPVSAGVLDTFSSVINLQPETFGIVEDPFDDTRYGFASVPATFDYAYSEGLNIYTWEWSKATAITYVEALITESGKTIEFIVNVGDGTDDLTVELTHAQFDFMFLGYEGITQHNFYYGLSGYAELVSDTGEVVYTVPGGDYDTFPVFDDLTFTCSQFFTVTYYSRGPRQISIDADMTAYDQAIYSELELLVEGEAVSLDSISIQIENLNNTVTDIGNDVGSIKTTVENIQDGVVEINGTVTDMKEQLEEPDSPIWSAAGEKIADTVTGLFVPTKEELDAEKQELENILNDKLGDAKVLLDMGETFIEDVRNVIGDIEDSGHVHFPGIIFPMNGEEYVIVPEQDVKISNSAFRIFQDALGLGINVLCWWSIIHICEDVIYCIISGVSYWGFIRSRHDK